MISVGLQEYLIENILKDDILRAYENLNWSTKIFSEGNFSRINSKTSSDVVNLGINFRLAPTPDFFGS